MIWTLDNSQSIGYPTPLYTQHTWKPYFIVKCPAAILIKILGTNMGDTLRWPLKDMVLDPSEDDSLSLALTALSKDTDVDTISPKLPIPDPMQTPLIE